MDSEVFSRFMMPKKLLSDRDPAFMGKIVKELFKLWGIEKVNTSSYHAQTNGLTERTNQTAIQVMKTLMAQYQTGWPKLIPRLNMSLRTAVNETTGKTPHEMMFGRLGTMPLDLALGRIDTDKIESDTAKLVAKTHKEARKVIEKHKLRQKFNYDRRHKEPEFQIGDLVLWEHKRLVNPETKNIPKKFKSNLYGPFRIIAKLGKNSFKLKDIETGEIISEFVNGEKLKRWYFRKIKPVKETRIHEDPVYVTPFSIKDNEEGSSSEDDEVLDKHDGKTVSDDESSVESDEHGEDSEVEEESRAITSPKQKNRSGLSTKPRRSSRLAGIPVTERKSSREQSLFKTFEVIEKEASQLPSKKKRS